MLVRFSCFSLHSCCLAVLALGTFTLGTFGLGGNRYASAQYNGPGYQQAPYGFQQPNGRVNQQRGATLGGLAGAVAGGLIGDNNGEAGAGAAIGGVIGAVTGGLLGNAADKEAVVSQQRRSYAATQQQVAVQREAVSVNDVVQMSRSGLSESVMITQIESRGVIAKPQVADIIALHQQGVSERVITAMQQAPTRQQITSPPPMVAQPTQVVRPVIIEERRLVPVYAPPPRIYHYPVGRHPRSGIHFRYHH